MSGSTEAGDGQGRLVEVNVEPVADGCHLVVGTPCR